MNDDHIHNDNKEIVNYQLSTVNLNVIVAQNLTKKFGDFTAVNSISFEVAKGELFGFLGANGAGKTTAMRMLCGLSTPTSGTGIVAGYNIETQSDQVKSSIGYMSQKFALHEDLKVWENIRLFAGIYGVPNKEIAQKNPDQLGADILNLAYGKEHQFCAYSSDKDGDAGMYMRTGYILFSLNMDQYDKTTAIRRQHYN